MGEWEDGDEVMGARHIFSASPSLTTSGLLTFYASNPPEKQMVSSPNEQESRFVNLDDPKGKHIETQ